MSQIEANTPANHFGGSFGPNEWLVQEMYEKYQSDPSSVDKSWWDFFADFKSTPSSHNLSADAIKTAPNKTNKDTALAKPGTPPIPKAQLAKMAKQNIPTETVILASTDLKPADPIVKPIPTLITPAAANVEQLRGVAARVVQSMEGSLTVPTATSVRVIPAKLMIDNRTVINNHLKRGRGGKVSFTHLIGYAMVKAIRALPEMNSFFTQLDGKPAVGHPEHINLGIAIDLAKPDGSRQLLVPSIKGCEKLDFAQFWLAYEDMVRRNNWHGSLSTKVGAGTGINFRSWRP